MTFVASPTKVLSIYEKTGDIGLLRQPTLIKVRVPIIVPQTVVEKKRFLLAGRRRGHRIEKSDEWNQLLQDFRKYVLSLDYATGNQIDNTLVDEDELVQIEKEIVSEMYFRHHKDVRVEGGMVVAEVRDHMDPIKIPLAEVSGVHN